MASVLCNALKSRCGYSFLRNISRQGADNKVVEKSIFVSSRKFGLWSSSSKKAPVLNSIEELAKFIKEHAGNVFVMVGAGISTPSGIPDFRSPGTGLYDNLQKYNLPYPEAIFDIHYFMMDPNPFFTLARDLYPGEKYVPNTVHHFLRLLHEEGKLQMVYTQNIDGLERLAGIPDEKLMEAHGTFSRASCTLCGRAHPQAEIRDAILEGRVPLCDPPKCKGKVKPDIVFFGENLPDRFWEYHNILPFTDLLLVMGTSLEVYPFAGVAEGANHTTPRVLLNLGPAGTLGTRPGDLLLLGDLVETVKALVKALGWQDKLRVLEEQADSTTKREE